MIIILNLTIKNLEACSSEDEWQRKEDVLRRYGEEGSSLKRLERRRAQSIGQSLTETVVKGMIEGRSRKERPRFKFVTQSYEEENMEHGTYQRLKKKANKREEWRAAVN